ncbi:MAG: pyridoxal-phosphate dependent enzyme [Myxococcales bacterium]|nr:pyridoxal-phosphate dependent enzyme [Myxococcales bacterium]
MMKWDDISTLDWMTPPTEVTSLDWLAAEHKCDFVGVKRDDMIGFGYGGSKIRKLDYLLASEPYRSADGWHAVGAIGSGNLVALGEAAEFLGKTLHAHCFWEPLSPGVLANLAFTAQSPSRMRYYRNRISMALANPWVLIRKRHLGLPVITPGASSPTSILGIIRAGLELAEQIRCGELPTPDMVYLAYGTGGTAIGLSIGLGLAGVKTTICAVSAVERVFSNRPLLWFQTRQALRYLQHIGLVEKRVQPVPIVFDHGELGGGYGYPTPRSLAMCNVLKRSNIELEAVYTGKAFSRLLRDLESGATKTPLLWNTARRALALPTEAWQTDLPSRLCERISDPSEQLGA